MKFKYYDISNENSIELESNNPTETTLIRAIYLKLIGLTPEEQIKLLTRLIEEELE